ncbi:amino acid adenylation domain-containing protein [Mariniflexile fucanivorans]|uniref:Amino acid adenylation domain-containing protein n=1 Tax=Mariniflexile fucanivorans TaxID=264023 RepID=A0A4R1RFV4_9FLAO|nr:AMP-binding protein [Mariniflexile fucanivorans]TCL64855.1 amino acid adenylation domain-containing protein [Mariniflexile fucanivorans]
MPLIFDIQNAIENNLSNNAFFINEKYYTYQEYSQIISNIRKSIKKISSDENFNVGLVTNDDIETYASIIALWLEGKTYVPLNPEFPKSRNQNIINQSHIKTILDSSSNAVFNSGMSSILTKQLPNCEIDLTPIQFSENTNAYILFTSGTTGTPKGVPITFDNLSNFINAFNKLCPNINSKDRFLQMFELTFDMSVVSYLAPLLGGACVYTIPKNKIKYSHIFEMMEDYKLTITIMVPSIINYLRPYFDEINCPDVRFNLFAGEALYLDVLEEWQKCLPNATIVNSYGPTETTIICTSYHFSNSKKNKTHNGIVCIGKDMENTLSIVVGDDEKELAVGETGELCISGKQVTPGYWENDERNEASFFYKNYNDENIRFYRTGDACFKDEDGDFLYVGRVDFQAKIQGYRVELSEIEFQVKSYLNKINAVCVAITNDLNNTEIGLVIESEDIQTTPLLSFLKTKLPQYMIPTQIKFIHQFPLNSNGKIDRNKLRTLFNK